MDMDTFYSSDEDFAWGKVTPREIKRQLKGQVRKKTLKSHSIFIPSHNSKETVISSETSILEDITNKSNISVSSKQDITANDIFNGEIKEKSIIDLPTIHIQPEMMLDNFRATLVNNTVLSEDAGYDVSILSSGNDINTSRKDEDSMIVISDDDSEEQNGHGNSLDIEQGSSDLFAKLKYERSSNCQGDTSDYHENVTLESGDASKEQLNISNCLSVSSTDEDLEEKYMSTVRDSTLQDNVIKRNSEHSIILEKEVSQLLQDSCEYIPENEMDSLTHLDCQSENEIELMSQLNYESTGNEICDPENNDSYEQQDKSENKQKGLNVSRHSLSKLDKDVATDEDTEQKCMSTDSDYHYVTLQDNDPERNVEHSIILETKGGYLDSQSENKIELMPQLDDEPTGNEICHPESNNSFEQYDVPENTQKGLNVSTRSLSQLDNDVSTDKDTEERCMSTDGDYHYVTPQDNDLERNSEHSIIIEKAVSQQIQDSCGYISENEKESMAHLDCQSEREIELMPHLDYGSARNEICNSDNFCERHDVPDNTQKGLNVSTHSLSQLDKDVSTDKDTEERCMSSDADYHYVTLQDNDLQRNIEHSIIIEKEVPQQIQDSCGNISENEKDSMAHLDCQSEREIEFMPQLNYESAGNEICHSDNFYEHYDEPENIQKGFNVSRHSLSKLNRDMNVILNDSIPGNSIPEINIKGDVHNKNEYEDEYFQNDNSDGREGSNMNKSSDSSNKEELNNTLEMVERMLNQHLEIHGKSIDNKNNTNSTLSSASKDKSRIPKMLKSPQIGDTFKVPQTSHKQKLLTPKSASKLNFKDVVSPVGLYIKYSPKPVLKQNVTAVEFKSPAVMKKVGASPQVSKPIRKHCQDFPAAIYKPSKKQVTSSAKKLFLPPSLEKMVQEPNLVKHEGIINREHNESDINRLLLSEAELTRYSISDSVLESSSQDTSILTTKHTLK